MRTENSGRHGRMEVENYKQEEEFKNKSENLEQKVTREDFPADNIQSWASLGDKDW